MFMAGICDSGLRSDCTTFAPTLHAARQARAWLEWLDRYVGDDTRTDLHLVVDELVTNAVVHAGLNDHQRIRVSAVVYPGSIRVTVADHGRGIPPVALQRRPPPTQPGGRGLWLVHRLASRVLIDGPRGRITVELSRHGR
jgi:anti-sigma regulatory factor (Ser/Thr protein kinase)